LHVWAAFKPDIDDLRESPAVQIASNLLTEGINIVCVEPNIHHHNSLPLIPLEQAVEKADIICYLVKHSVFSKFLNPIIKLV
jgi:UDP-N-acetyl-D-mannosaminuronic acid dehydrogenase